MNMLDLTSFFHLCHWPSVRDLPLVGVAQLAREVWFVESRKEIESVQTVAQQEQELMRE